MEAKVAAHFGLSLVGALSVALRSHAAVPSPANRYAKAALENCTETRKTLEPLVSGEEKPTGFVKATWEARLGSLRFHQKSYLRYRDQALAADPSLRTSEQQVAGLVLKDAWGSCDQLFETYEKRLEELAAAWQADKEAKRPGPPPTSPSEPAAAPGPAPATESPKTIAVGFRNETEDNVCEIWLAPRGTEDWKKLPSITWIPGPGALRTASIEPGRYGLWVKQCAKAETVLKEPDVDLTQPREVVVLGPDRTPARPSSDWDAGLRLVLKTPDAKKPTQRKAHSPCVEDRDFCLSACGSSAQQCEIDCLHNQGQSPACYQRCRDQTDRCRGDCRARYAKCR